MCIIAFVRSGEACTTPKKEKAQTIAIFHSGSPQTLTHYGEVRAMRMTSPCVKSDNSLSSFEVVIRVEDEQSKCLILLHRSKSLLQMKESFPKGANLTEDFFVFPAVKHGYKKVQRALSAIKAIRRNNNPHKLPIRRLVGIGDNLPEFIKQISPIRLIRRIGPIRFISPIRHIRQIERVKFIGPIGLISLIRLIRPIRPISHIRPIRPIRVIRAISNLLIIYCFSPFFFRYSRRA